MQQKFYWESTRCLCIHVCTLIFVEPIKYNVIIIAKPCASKATKKCQNYDKIILNVFKSISNEVDKNFLRFCFSIFMRKWSWGPEAYEIKCIRCDFLLRKSRSVRVDWQFYCYLSYSKLQIFESILIYPPN